MLFADYKAKRLRSIEDTDLIGGGGLWNGSIGGRRIDLPNGGGSFPVATTNTAQTSSAPIDFDFDLSQINRAIARGNTRADVLSAYEVFQTGTSRGRGLGYAQDVLRRFTPGLIQTYGAANIRIAAANYLDSAGLPRLARIVAPEPTPGPGPVPTPVPTPTPAPTPETPAPRNPVELLLDALPAIFGQATYNPPLQSQAYGYSPVRGDFGGAAPATSGGGLGLWLILGAVAVIGYFVYKRFSG